MNLNSRAVKIIAAFEEAEAGSFIKYLSNSRDKVQLINDLNGLKNDFLSRGDRGGFAWCSSSEGRGYWLRVIGETRRILLRKGFSWR